MTEMKLINNEYIVPEKVARRIKKVKDLNDFYAYVEEGWEYTEEELDNIPTYLFPEKHQERIDKMFDRLCYSSGCYDYKNVDRIFKGVKLELWEN